MDAHPQLVMPEKLRRSPLVEALFEMRFEATTAAAGDLLPGLLFRALRDRYPTVTPLPMAGVPREIRDRDPNLAYQPSHRLTDGIHSVQIGDRVLVVSTLEYPGWTSFSQTIGIVLASARETELMRVVQRYSFRYINVIRAEPTAAQLEMLNARIELVGARPVERGFQLRFERDDDSFTTVTQIVPNTVARKPSGELVSGLLIDVDTIQNVPTDELFARRKEALDRAHSVVKRAFFSTLSPHTLETLEPTP